jgi:phosphatidylserine decarboxylase
VQPGSGRLEPEVVEPGDDVARGERIGLMKFGSRMDVFLPLDMDLLVSAGDRVVGGETILARAATTPTGAGDGRA